MLITNRDTQKHRAQWYRLEKLTNDNRTNPIGQRNLKKTVLKRNKKTNDFYEGSILLNELYHSTNDLNKRSFVRKRTKKTENER